MAKFNVDGEQNVEVSVKLPCEKPLLEQLEIMEAYTQTHKANLSQPKEVREVECLKVLYPRMFRSIELQDRIAGRIDFLPVGFGTVTSLGGVGHFCVFNKLREFQKKLAKEKDKKRVDFLYDYWLEHDLKTRYCQEVLTDHTIGRFIDCEYPLIATARLSGMMLDYPKLLERGIGGLREDIQENNKQQYGYEMWDYDKLPQLYELAKQHGCDTLGLFGWYASGHDNQYPDLEVSETLGGAEALKENIKKVQEAGGHVTLYQQGHLIDPTTKFYKIRGHRLESKSRTGMPYFEYYCKSHKSSFLNVYTNKLFAISCPSCPEWQELMEEKTDFAASFGPDGVLFDQIGGMHPYPCFDESHPHEKGKPSLSLSGGRRALLPRIRSRANMHGNEFAFFSEHITDIYSAYLDCVHGINSKPSAEGDRSAAAAGRRPEAGMNYPELFRYTFPETIITIRNSAPVISVRMANYAAVFGFRYEMEIRYQDDCDDLLNDRWPQEREYARKVSDLRRKYWEILGYGRFSDEENIRNSNPALIVKGFKKDDLLAVLLWNDTQECAGVSVDVDGYTLVEVSSVEGMRTCIPEQMDSQELLLAVYKKS